jgi:adenylate cyclase
VDKSETKGPKRIGVRLALMALVLGAIAISTTAVYGLWWRTATANSRLLVETINRQIVSAVQKELAQNIAAAEGAFGAVRTIFLQNVIETREADKREFVFLSQLQAQPSISWVAFGWPDGDFFASHKLGEERLEMMEVSIDEGKRQRRVDRYDVVPGDIHFSQRSFEPSEFRATDQPWFQQAINSDGPKWLDVTDHPGAKRAAIAFAGPIDVYQSRQGVLAVMIELTRLSRFLGGLDLGMSGAAFILGSDGHIVAGPDPEADEEHLAEFSRHRYFSVIREAGGMVLAHPDDTQLPLAHHRIVDGGRAFDLTTTPLSFRGWQIATIIPESEFLGEIERTIRRLVLAVAGLVLVAGVVSAWLAQRFFAEPIRALVDDLRQVENFTLDRLERRPSRLAEMNQLSGALSQMATGLASFGKYLPLALVRNLVREGIEATPGGSIRPVTIMFVDVVGFTGLSERLGAGIVPVIGSYLDAVSRAVEREGGTIDKFIGDAVMAFWGAPSPDAEHAYHACRGALASLEAIAKCVVVDDAGAPLRVRIGLNSGDALVGNIGSVTRLNYTAIGDVVNVASRLEGANKLYGTSIIIGEATRSAAGKRIAVREIDRVAVMGRAQGVTIFELLDLAGEDAAPDPEWIGAYEAGLARYRAHRWAEAIEAFEAVIAIRGFDGPAEVLLERCRGFMQQAPPDDWDAVARLTAK